MKNQIYFTLTLLGVGVLITTFIILFAKSYYPTVFLSGETNIVNAKILRLDHPDGTVSLISRSTGNRISDFDFFYSPLFNKDTLTVFVANDKRGYFNLYTLKIQILPQFDRAWQFDAESGLAAVVEDNKLGFINSQGDYIVPPRFPYNRNKYISSSFIFKDNYCIIPDGKSGLIGLINTTGLDVISPEYQEIKEIEKGYWLVMKNNQYGLLDSAFNQVLSPIYDEILITDAGIIISKGIKKQLIGFDYKTVLISNLFDFVYKLYTIEDKYTESYNPLSINTIESGYSVYSVNGKCGLLEDATGMIQSQPYFDAIYYHSPGVFRAVLNDFTFIIDSQGNSLNISMQ
jgi:hypothetical protein